MNAADGFAIEAAWRDHSRPVLATLIRLLGGFDIAEEALSDAFLAAQQSWPKDGIPQNPRSWLVSAGRYRAIDRLRKRARFDAAQREIADRMEADAEMSGEIGDEVLRDDQLRLVFICCHPQLAPEMQIALTLRTVCGLTTEEIARAFLAATPTIAQRIVRAKTKIREAGIRYEVPGKLDLPERLETVLGTVYLVFNEGYSAHSGEQLMRLDLASEAIRLGRLIIDLLPDAEALGLVGLMLLQNSRRHARIGADGGIILLEDQDRTLWDHDAIREGRALIDRAFATGEVGSYAIQGAIAAVHALAKTPEATDWAEIVRLYDLLLRSTPSPVVRLNRAVAVGMQSGPQAGIELISALLAEGALDTYHLAHAAHADMHRRAGNTDLARAAYQRALELSNVDPERRFLRRRLDELKN
ncbi:MAG: RNA polymerase sigma factor [Rhizobiaceae bacterium]